MGIIIAAQYAERTLCKNEKKSTGPSRSQYFRNSGAVEPNAQGCAFAHPIFQPEAMKL